MQSRVDVDFSLAMHVRTGKYFIGRNLLDMPDLPIGDQYFWMLRSDAIPRGLLRRLLGRAQLWHVKGRTLGGHLGWLPARASPRPLLHLDPFTVPTAKLGRRDIVLCHDIGPVTHPDLFDRDVGAIYRSIYGTIEVDPTGRTTAAGPLIGDRPLVSHPHYAAKAAVVFCRCGDVVNAAALSIISTAPAPDAGADAVPSRQTSMGVWFPRAW